VVGGEEGGKGLLFTDSRWEERKKERRVFPPYVISASRSCERGGVVSVGGGERRGVSRLFPSATDESGEEEEKDRGCDFS